MSVAEAWDAATPDPTPNGAEPTTERRYVTAGGRFILDQGEPVPALWGHDDAALWAKDESLLVVGSTGLGKSTLAQRVALAQLGLTKPEVLGLPVAPVEGKVLYLAADRPRQIARSFRRMVTEAERAILDERLVVSAGPPPFNMVREPWRLSLFVQELGCCEVIVDSLKDLAPSLSSDETGGAVNQAFQHCVAAGVDVLGIHHNRKATAENPRPRALADVYGSAWLTSGAGSVVALWAPSAGSPIVEVLHLKQPSHEVGPLTALVDIEAGDLVVQHQVDLLAVLRGCPRGMAPAAAAAALFSTSDPTRPQVEKGRRQLERLVVKSLATKRAGPRDEAGHGGETVYFATPATEPPS